MEGMQALRARIVQSSFCSSGFHQTQMIGVSFRFRTGQTVPKLQSKDMFGFVRCTEILAAYMMKKYSWGLRKTMEFLSSRRPGAFRTEVEIIHEAKEAFLGRTLDMSSLPPSLKRFDNPSLKR